MEWTMMILFREIERRRVEICHRIPDFRESPVVIIHGLKQYICDPFLDVCFERHIIPHVIPSDSFDQVQPCDLCMFAATKNILARTRKDPRMNVQCQDIDRLLSAIQAVSMMKNIRKSFYRAGIAFDFHNDLLWTRVDLRGCHRVSHFPGQEQLPLPEDSRTHPWRLANVHDGEFPVIPFTTALDEGKDQTPYRFIPDSSVESDSRWTWAMQLVLEDEFPAGTDDRYWPVESGQTPGLEQGICLIRLYSHSLVEAITLNFRC
jgi:hypothetical protein